MGEDGGPVEEPVVRAARCDLGARRPAGLDQAADLGKLAGVDDGAQVDVVAVRVADGERVRLGGQPLDVLVVQGRVHQVASGRHADLALVEERAPGGGGDHRVEVGVLEHDHGRVAAQFQVRPLEVTAGGLADSPSGGRGAREGDDRHARVGDQGLSGVRAAGEHMQQVLRQARGGEDRREGQTSADGGARVRLQEDRVAQGQGRRDGADGQDQRGVER